MRRNYEWIFTEPHLNERGEMVATLIIRGKLIVREG